MKTVDCLIGLQWGSEGKGKVSAYLSNEYNAMVRSGGHNAGHTFYKNEIKYVNQQIPCGVINPETRLYISAAGVVKFGVLIREIQKYKIYPERLMIDSHTMIVTDKHIEIELKELLKDKIGSTSEGIGAATSGKVMRKEKLFDFYAEEDPELYFFCGNVTESLHEQINKKHTILLEGTQGSMLSLNHGDYPYCTSRDVTTSSLLSDAGISPKHHGKTIGVMRTYPIRVGGNSGPTGSKELNWEKITKMSNSPVPLTEITTVTKRVRRVFEQNYSALENAVMINSPDEIALMFIDYINHDDYGKKSFNDLSNKSLEYIFYIEKRFNTPVTLIGTGPFEEHIIDRRKKSMRRRFVKDGFIPNAFQDYCYYGVGGIERYIDTLL